MLVPKQPADDLSTVSCQGQHDLCTLLPAPLKRGTESSATQRNVKRGSDVTSNTPPLSHLRKAGRTSCLRDRFSSMPVTQKNELTNMGSNTKVSIRRCDAAGTKPPAAVGMRRSNSP